MKLCQCVIFLLAATLALSSQVAFSADKKAGKQAYMLCQSCHGEKATGNQALNAPGLLHQGADYLRQQLLNYKRGYRGVHQDDKSGAQMKAMADNLKTDQDIENVVAYIVSLPKAKSPATLKGNNKNGKDYYNMVCGSCHGPKAEGNAILKAPPLAGIDDWYLVNQFEAFQKGYRGTHPDDKLGAQMRAMVKALPDEKVVKDVMSYINTLQNP